MQRTVGYLTGNSLVIYPPKGKEQKILFPADLVDDCKVLKPEEFIAYLSQELEAHAGKNNEIVIVVGNNILYQHAYPPKAKDEKERKEQFHATIAFSKADWLTKIIETETKTYEIVTHREYINAVAKACEGAKMKVVGFIPLSLFSDNASQDTLPLTLVEEIRKSADLYEDTSFDYITTKVNGLPEESESSTQEVFAPAPAEREFVIKQRGFNTGGVLFIFVLILLIVLSAIGGFFLLQNTIGKANIEKEVTPSQTPTPTPQETINKRDITIQVLNGTGTAGQAGKVQAAFEEAGFESVETGNADEKDHEAALVAFSDKVGEKEQQEIMNLLKEIFVTVDKKATDGAEFMVIITTGEEK